MAAQGAKIVLEGSERKRLSRAHDAGSPPPDERLEVAVVVRRRPLVGDADPRKTVAQRRLSASADSFEAASTGSLGERKPMARAEFAAIHGADPNDLAAVEKFAKDSQLVVVKRDAARRTVWLSGTVETLSNAFAVNLRRFDHPHGSYRGRTGPIHIPAKLKGIVKAVLGLDDRPQAKPRFQILKDHPGLATARAAGNVAFSPNQIAKLYDFPAGADGTGECIGIIELGGGYRPGDLRTYFKQIGIPLPNVSAASVDGGQNAPTGDPDGPDGEVMLDIEVAGAVAPKAKIVVYFAPNTDKGFLDAITHAIHDSTNNPSVLSISWGGPEVAWTGQAMQAMDAALQDAARLGVTVCVAAGDNGSGDGVGDDLAHVDFPASSPHALACGGTRLNGSGSVITGETAWDDDPNSSATGGGVSEVFGLPDYQKNAAVPPSVNPGRRIGRGVPDVSGDADPETGYRVRVDGVDTVIGGTSAVAPLWAGLIALFNQRHRTKLGFLNPLIYGRPAAIAAFRDITQGNNGDYQCRRGWDACTGWGSPDGTKLLNALK